ncbi:hypothetical protein ASPTUDRAFT_35369 [Aspergillus tubingensis CBS 134.48]|uniref:Uncharacterized protein n=1 Tax=Aspergillus tubingensis (strain CBS 134.48) TaxID=767770 RepID=A0A1L9NGM2_ASPTC|nr:hypothetical protein ASPTUDRAFT_35369 [Aspergillus tubingensis CBS 134.48]
MTETCIKKSATEYRSLDPVPPATSGESAVWHATPAACASLDELVTNIIVSKGYWSVDHKLQQLNGVLRGHLSPCPANHPCRPMSSSPTRRAAGRASGLAADRLQLGEENGNKISFLRY